MVNFDNKENFELLDMRNEEHPFDVIMQKANSTDQWEWFCVQKEHQITPLVQMIWGQWFETFEEEQDDWSFKTYFLKI